MLYAVSGILVVDDGTRIRLIFDGVVKSPISFVVGFSQNLNIPYVLLRA